MPSVSLAMSFALARAVKSVTCVSQINVADIATAATIAHAQDCGAAAKAMIVVAQSAAANCSDRRKHRGQRPMPSTKFFKRVMVGPPFRRKQGRQYHVGAVISRGPESGR